MKCSDVYKRKIDTPELASSNMSATNKPFDVDEFNRKVQQAIALRNHNNSKTNVNPINNQQQNKHTQQRPDNEWFDYDAFVTWAKNRKASTTQSIYLK